MNLADAKGVIEAAKSSGAQLNNFVYTVLSDTCVECQNLKPAEFQDMFEMGGHAWFVLSFNTLIMAHLQFWHIAKACALIEEVKKEGWQPTNVTFSELVNATIAKVSARSSPRSGALWRRCKRQM